MEEFKMYVQINPEYIVANFEKPYTLSRLIKVLFHEVLKRFSFKRFMHELAKEKYEPYSAIVFRMFPGK